MAVTEAELRRERYDEAVKRKVKKNKLKGILLSLVNLLETESKESQEREKEKDKESLKVISVHSSWPSQQSLSTNERPSTPRDSQPRYPSSIMTPDNKRNVSSSSYGVDDASTENTPIRMVHAEAKVQSLQNKFVDTILDELWLQQIPVPWATGRQMFLTYTAFSPTYSKTD